MNVILIVIVNIFITTHTVSITNSGCVKYKTVLIEKMSQYFAKNRWALVASLSIPFLASLTFWFVSRSDKKKKKRGYSRDLADLRSSSSEDLTGPGAWNSLGLEQPLVIAMVGLPARGKSYLVKMILRYLKWTGFECAVFNVGSYRRKIGLQSADSKFFSAANEDAQKVREEMAMAVQAEMYAWLHASEGAKKRVAIFDATNTTRKRRYALAQKARSENVFLLFVESICNDPEVLSRNYALKLQNEDYSGMDPDQAKQDFMARVEAYEKVYEVSIRDISQLPMFLTVI